MPKRRSSRGGNGLGNGFLEILAESDLPAYAADDEDRIVFWNRGAESLFGRGKDEVLGRFCYDVVRGRDLLGRQHCYRDCPIVANRRLGEPACGCEVVVPTASGETRTVSIMILEIPAENGGSGASLHLLRPLDEAGPLAEMLERVEAEAEPRASKPAPAASHAVPPLTVREGEILCWVALGLQNKEVAQKLGISLATVRNHIHNILDKLQVHSKLEAVSLAFRSGWVSAEPDGDMVPVSEPPLPRLALGANGRYRLERAGAAVTPAPVHGKVIGLRSSWQSR
jgi:PAS domain S-box-containing protein